MDNLINKYLNNSLTPKEAEQLRLWLQKDVKNKIEFENIVTHLKHSDEELSQVEKRVFEKIVAKGSRNIKIDSGHKIRYIANVAAVFVIIFGSLFLLLKYKYQTDEQSVVAQKQTVTEVEKETANGQQLSFRLPDGTKVKLNAGSKLTFSKAFDANIRKVKLTGEAFFDVERDESKPFIIETEGVNVKVLGTSFNVKSYADDQDVWVGVKTGTVKVSSISGNQEVVLSKNDLASYSNKTHLLNKSVISEAAIIFGWVDKELAFNDFNIDQILVELSRWYDVEFVIEGKLDKKRKITSRYKNPTLKSVMESLVFVYGYKYEINEKIVTIRK